MNKRQFRKLYTTNKTFRNNINRLAAKLSATVQDAHNLFPNSVVSILHDEKTDTFITAYGAFPGAYLMFHTGQSDGSEFTVEHAIELMCECLD